MIIKRNQPIRAYTVLNAITEETRAKIIKLLLKKSPLTLTEIQDHIKKSLSTLQFHVNILEKAGILGWKTTKKGRKTTKAYFVKENLISIEIDIPSFVEAVHQETIRELAAQLVDIILSKGIALPRQLDIATISSLLEIDTPVAIAVRDYINTYEDEFAAILAEKLGSLITEDIFDLEKKLKIDIYWVAKIAKHLKKI